jgi:predicted enzyme related to lactoylglutathione lyase
MAEDWARPVVHWEIEAKDGEKIAKFYSELFNWEAKGGKVKGFSEGIGAPEKITGHMRTSTESRVSLYIQVLKLADTIEKAKTLGGKLVREPFDAPTGQGLAWIDDPEGNRIVLVQQ